MEDSILKTIKKVLGYDLDEAFDLDFMIHINTVFATLTDLGIGPEDGFEIEDETTTWTDFYGDASQKDKTLNRVKTYVYLKVKLYFDPPQTGHHMSAANEQVAELEGRLQTHREVQEWTRPAPTMLP